jgi:hypothetical protein
LVVNWEVEPTSPTSYQFFMFWTVLGTELKTSHLLGKCSTTSITLSLLSSLLLLMTTVLCYSKEKEKKQNSSLFKRWNVTYSIRVTVIFE